MACGTPLAFAAGVASTTDACPELGTLVTVTVAAFTQVWTMTVPAGAVTVTDVIPSCARSTLAQPSVCGQTSCAALAAVPNAVTPRALSATVAAAARRTVSYTHLRA